MEKFTDSYFKWQNLNFSKQCVYSTQCGIHMMFVVVVLLCLIIGCGSEPPGIVPYHMACITYDFLNIQTSCTLLTVGFQINADL